MLWFNNHSWDQEHFYAEAREFMREQRRQQQRANASEVTDKEASVLGYLGLSVFFFFIGFIPSGNIVIGLVAALASIIGLRLDRWIKDSNHNRKTKYHGKTNKKATATTHSKKKRKTI